jgi:diguanylate cyclase (GGDEF)-like protein
MSDSENPHPSPGASGSPPTPAGGSSTPGAPAPEEAQQPPGQSASVPTPASAASAPSARSASGAGAPPHTSPVSYGPENEPEHAPESPKRAIGASVSSLIVALLFAALGIAGSIVGAHSLAKHDALKARQTFKSNAAAVAATVGRSIQQEQDLVSGAGTYFAGNSNTTPEEFKSWAGWVHALDRFPQIERLGLVSIVRAPQLPAHEALLAGQPASPAKPARTSSLRITPTGARPYYCLTIGEILRSPALPISAGHDYCGRTHTLLISRDTGLASYAATTIHGHAALRLQAPVYRGDAPPATQSGRMAAFAGWVRETLVPGVILRQALDAHGGGNGSLELHSGVSTFVFSTGGKVSRAQSHSTSIPGGWKISSFAAAPASGIRSDPGALALLIAGCALSILLGLLILLVGTPRNPQPAPVPRERPRDVPSEALYDTLTGLPNRGLTFDRAERMLARAGRESGLIAGALFVDIDWFKDFNDKLGEAAGDQLLRVVADRLQTVVRAHDTVGRLNADKFLILVESAARGARLDSLARRVIEALHKPVELEGFGPSFFPTASIGVAFGRYETPEELVRDSQLALQASKSGGRDRFTIYNANMRSVIEDAGVLEAELNTALEERQFFLLYQPVLDLATQKVIGLEALLRWLHPKRGVLAPADFLPVAEDSGLIVPIGRWALEEACGRAASWDVAGHPLEIAVSVSPHQLSRDGFATDVQRALQQSGIRPALLTLEVAESTIMQDVADATRRLHEVKRFGVRLAIDEFGSGYAYRSDLERMPLDYLKVDRSSLASADDEDYRSWLLEAILVFGRDLSLTVVAKGVETYEQMTALRDMGCPLAQGFFLGKPMPAEAVEALFRAQEGMGQKSLAPVAGVTAPEPAQMVAEAPAEPAEILAGAAPEEQSEPPAPDTSADSAPTAG